MPSLCSSGPDLTPKPRSTRNAVMRSLRPPSRSTSVCANTVKKSAMPPLVIQILLPSRTKLPSGCAHADRRRVRAGAGLGQAERRDHLAGGEARQIALLLLVVAVEHQALAAD